MIVTMFTMIAQIRMLSGDDLVADGKVIDARVVREVPNGYGFGRSAAETVKAEWKFDGAAAGRYRLKLKFAQ